MFYEHPYSREGPRAGSVGADRGVRLPPFGLGTWEWPGVPQTDIKVLISSIHIYINLL